MPPPWGPYGPNAEDMEIAQRKDTLDQMLQIQYKLLDNQDHAKARRLAVQGEEQGRLDPTGGLTEQALRAKTVAEEEQKARPAARAGKEEPGAAGSADKQIRAEAKKKQDPAGQAGTARNERKEDGKEKGPSRSAAVANREPPAEKARGKAPPKAEAKKREESSSSESSYYSSYSSEEVPVAAKKTAPPAHQGGKRGPEPPKKMGRTRSPRDPEPQRRQEDPTPGRGRSLGPRDRTAHSPPPGVWSVRTRWDSVSVSSGSRGNPEEGRDDGRDRRAPESRVAHLTARAITGRMEDHSSKDARDYQLAQDWVRSKEKQGAAHWFGHHKPPDWWPLAYYDRKRLVCPPQVPSGSPAAGSFHADQKHVFTFHGLLYAYIGPQEAPAKAHWEPFPLPPEPCEGKGKGKGKAPKGGKGKGKGKGKGGRGKGQG
jgi:hypothetical protein